PSASVRTPPTRTCTWARPSSPPGAARRGSAISTGRWNWPATATTGPVWHATSCESSIRRNERGPAKGLAGPVTFRSGRGRSPVAGQRVAVLRVAGVTPGGGADAGVDAAHAAVAQADHHGVRVRPLRDVPVAGAGRRRRLEGDALVPVGVVAAPDA